MSTLSPKIPSGAEHIDVTDAGHEAQLVNVHGIGEVAPESVGVDSSLPPEIVGKRTRERLAGGIGGTAARSAVEFAGKRNQAANLLNNGDQSMLGGGSSQG